MTQKVSFSLLLWRSRLLSSLDRLWHTGPKAQTLRLRGFKYDGQRRTLKIRLNCSFIHLKLWSRRHFRRFSCIPLLLKHPPQWGQLILKQSDTKVINPARPIMIPMRKLLQLSSTRCCASSVFLQFANALANLQAAGAVHSNRRVGDLMMQINYA